MAKHGDVGRVLDALQTLMSGGLSSELIFRLAAHPGAMQEAFTTAERCRQAEWRLTERYQIVEERIPLLDMPHGSVAWIELKNLTGDKKSRSARCASEAFVHPAQSRVLRFGERFEVLWCRIPIYRTYNGSFWTFHAFKLGSGQYGPAWNHAPVVHLFDDLNKVQMQWLFRQVPGHTREAVELPVELTDLEYLYINREAYVSLSNKVEARFWRIQLGVKSAPSFLWGNVEQMNAKSSGLWAEPRGQLAGFDAYYLIEPRISTAEVFDAIAFHLGQELTQMILEAQHDESKLGAHKLSAIGPELLGFGHIVPYLK